MCTILCHLSVASRGLQISELPTIRIFPYFPGKSLPCPLYGNRWELYGYLKIVKWPLKSTLTVLHVHCTCAAHELQNFTYCARNSMVRKKRCKIRKNIARIRKTQSGGWQLCTGHLLFNYNCVGTANCTDKQWHTSIRSNWLVQLATSYSLS